jgi:hypothetical protein
MISHLAAGPKRIRVTSDGYGAAERTVDVQPARVTRVTLELPDVTPGAPAVESSPR